ncbi:MAG: right-handed parallel beta-helix repeat-containing protein [Jatrophihabitans sp.]
MTTFRKWGSAALALVSALAVSAATVTFPADAATGSGLQLPPVCTTDGPYPGEQAYPPPPLSLFQPASSMIYCRAGRGQSGQGLEAQTLTGASTSVTFTQTGGWPTGPIEYCADVSCTTKKGAQVTGAIFWPASFDDSGTFDTVTSADTPWDPTTHGWRKQPSEIDFRLDRNGTCGTENESSRYISGPASFSCTYSITWFTKPKHDAVVSFGNLHVGLASAALAGKKVGDVCSPSSPGGPFDNCSNFVGAGAVEAVLLFGQSAPVPPTVDFTATTVGSPLHYQFLADAKPTDGATIASYVWHFDDGAPGTGRTPTHTFPKAGTYHVTVTVTDSNGQQTTVGRDLVVVTGLVVNSVADTANGANAGIGCDTGATVGTPAVPECTLRAAIQAANARGTAQSITFAIPGAGTPSIAVAGALPPVTAAVTIDGTTESGGWVGLTGSATIDGLDLRGGASTVTGFVFSGFRFATVLRFKSKNTVSGNRFGVNAGGTAVTVAPVSAIAATNGTTDVTIKDNVIAASGAAVQAIGGATGTVTGNRIGVRSDGTANLTALPTGGVLLRDAGAFTVEKNTISAQGFGVLLRGSSQPGTSISANHIGTTSSGSAALSSFGFGVVVDAVPSATVFGNVVSVSRGTFDFSADIMVTGSEQCANNDCNSPDTATSGPVTGSNTTVRKNTLGVLANGSGAGAAGSYGVLAFAKAAGLSVSGNVVAGHFQPGRQVAEIELVGSTKARVTGNTLGLNAAGTAVIRADVGVDVIAASGTVVDDNLIGGASVAGVQVGSTSSDTALSDNLIGVNRTATAPLANDVGILVTGHSTGTDIAPHNLVSGNTHAGIRITDHAVGTTITEDVVGPNANGTKAIPNGTGVEVGEQADKVVVSKSLIAGNTSAGIRTTSTGLVIVLSSSLGRRGLPNGVGIDAHGPMTLSKNAFRSNLGAGLVSAPSQFVYAFDNNVFTDNGDVGIVSPGLPSAPTIAPVLTTGSNGKPRLRLVVSGGSNAVLGLVSVYANPDCARPGTATTPVAVKIRFSGTHSVIVVPTTKSIAAAYTATVSVLAQPHQPKGDIYRPFGRTSAISTCVKPHAYPDTSGTGIPDVIQTALGGDPAKPNTVAFLGADSYPYSLTTSQGQFTDVVDDPAVPALPAGVMLPGGPYSFSVSGVKKGSAVTVHVDHFSAGATPTSYWRYGRPTAKAPPQWYRWDYSSITHLGAEQGSLPGTFDLDFVDGLDGDDDGKANGTIVDPGAPAVEAKGVRTPSPTTSSPTERPTVSAPSPAPTTSNSEATAATGNYTLEQLLAAALLLATGAAALLAGRRRRRPTRRR